MQKALKGQVLVSIVLLVATITLAGGSSKGPERGAVLVALQEELQRAFAGFAAKSEQAPYFIGYSVTETESAYASATLGSLQSSSRSRSRLLDVDIRVGDRQLDNTHRIKGGRFPFASFPVPAYLPIEDDASSLKAAIWLETDRKYREAVEALTQVRTNRAVSVKEEDASADFSKEEAQTYVGPPVQLKIESREWEAKLREYSALFAPYPEVLTSSVSLSATATTEYFASSEGSAIQQGSLHYRLSVTARAKADDGMELNRYEAFDARTVDRLPSGEVVRAMITEIATSLAALRQAPAVEPYTGPAILEGRAAGVFFHEIFGHRIEGHRQKDEEFAQTFTKKVGEPILPEFISVYDDPTLERSGERDLNGFYRYDHEGVKAQRVTVVDKGVLKGFLMSRSPVAGFPQSNGHGRKAIGRRAVTRQGNLIIETSTTVSDAKLRQLLVEECTRQGKPYGLIFRSISGGFTFTGRGGPQAFQVDPLVVYRLYPDGREELVRGVDIIGTPLTSFSKILAASDTREVFNGYCGAESGSVPVSAVAPSILTAEIEVQKEQLSPQRPPLLPPPTRKERP
jgi:TldD protein